MVAHDLPRWKQGEVFLLFANHFRPVPSTASRLERERHVAVEIDSFGVQHAKADHWIGHIAVLSSGDHCCATNRWIFTARSAVTDIVNDPAYCWLHHSSISGTTAIASITACSPVEGQVWIKA